MSNGARAATSEASNAAMHVVGWQFATPTSRRAQHNLPWARTSLVGRERVLAEVRHLLESGACRLLTVTGTGGTGKTRVALAAATAVRDQFQHGAWFVALAPISDPRLVAPTIAQTLGVRFAGGGQAVNGLRSFLRERHLLLVLDNFEQVLSAAFEIGELLATCPRLHCLVTSRAALRLSGERELFVPPLLVPERQRVPPAPNQAPEVAMEIESVRLFVERAQLVHADFGLTDDNVATVAEICRGLDGLPLAIELAAARIRLLDPRAMLARLEHRLDLLTGGARDSPARQHTLRSTIAWSYDLLESTEQMLFRRLAVFVGGCTLEAARAVCNGDIDVLDVADSLATKSLVQAVVGPQGEVRLSMLETIREFGLEQLAWNGELEALRRQHAEYFVQLSERAEPELWGADASTWHARLDADHDNLRAALMWGLSTSGELGMSTALRLAGALSRFWWTRSHHGEGRQWLTRVLAVAPGRCAARMKALHGAGWLAHVLHDPAAARHLLDESLSIARELRDRWAEAWVLHVLGRVAYFDGDAAAARAYGERSLAIAESLRDPPLIGWSVHLLALAAHIAGDYATADELYQRSLLIRQASGFGEQVAVLKQLMGVSKQRQGDFAKARVLYLEYLAMAREFGSIFHISNALGLCGSLAAVQGQPERAARLIGAAVVFHGISQTQPIPLNETLFKEGAELSRQALGETAFGAAWEAGKTMSSEEAVAEALAVEIAPDHVPADASPTGSELSPRSYPAGLTRAEVEVLRHLAAGWKTPAIAAELAVAVSTVERHITHIYDKVGNRGRAAATTFALRHGLV